METGEGTLPPADVDLPQELWPVYLRHGARWRIGYDPLCRSAPYTARPHHGGRQVRTDTARLLNRVLTAVDRERERDETSTAGAGESVPHR